MVKDVIYSTIKSGMTEITMSKRIKDITHALRDFLYSNVYESELSRQEFKKARKILLDLYEYYLVHTDEVFKEYPRETISSKNK